MRIRRHPVNRRGRRSSFETKDHGFITKQVDIKIFVPGQKDIHHICRAKHGEYINEKGIEAILDQESAQLDSLKDYEFRLVELASNKFNFVGSKKDERVAESMHLLGAKSEPALVS